MLSSLKQNFDMNSRVYNELGKSSWSSKDGGVWFVRLLDRTFLCCGLEEKRTKKQKGASCMTRGCHIPETVPITFG